MGGGGKKEGVPGGTPTVIVGVGFIHAWTHVVAVWDTQITVEAMSHSSKLGQIAQVPLSKYN